VGTGCFVKGKRTGAHSLLRVEVGDDVSLGYVGRDCQLVRERHVNERKLDAVCIGFIDGKNKRITQSNSSNSTSDMMQPQHIEWRETDFTYIIIVD
jgi:hypothetical protein